MNEKSLYERLGGYDAIAAVANDLLGRLQADSALGRFWLHRGSDGIAPEKQLLIDFLCANAAGPMVYTGREMSISHVGMQISENDWSTFISHLNATLDSFELPKTEHDDVVAFVESTRVDIVEKRT